MTLPDGAQSLEVDDTPQGPVASAEPPPAPAVAPPVVADEDDAPESEGAMVPLASLREARSHLKTLKAQNQELAAKAAELDRILPTIKTWQPAIEALRARPDLLQQATAPKPPDPVESRISDEDAADYARDIQLYDQTGKLDIPTAKRALARSLRMSEQAAREAAQSVVAPLQQRDATREKDQTRALVLAQAQQEGDPIDPATFDTLWSVLPAELVAQNPAGIGELVKRLARGSAPRRAGVAPPPPVVPTEAPGGRTSPVSALTDLDRKFAHLTGATHSDYATTRAKFKPGQVNVLED